MLGDLTPVGMRLNGPAEIAAIDHVNQQPGQQHPAGAAEGKPHDAHAEALAHEYAEELPAAGAEGAAQSQFRSLLARHYQQHEGDPADGDEQAHELQQAGHREGLVEDGDDFFPQAPVAPHLKGCVGQGSLQLGHHGGGVGAGFKIEGGAVHGAGAEGRFHGVQVHDDGPVADTVIGVHGHNRKSLDAGGRVKRQRIANPHAGPAREGLPREDAAVLTRLHVGFRQGAGQ